MIKNLDRSYHIPSIKMLLSIFDLDLEEFQQDKKASSLKIYLDELEKGKVEFRENEITIKAISKYGNLEAKINYAKAFTLRFRKFKNDGNLWIICMLGASI